MQICHVSRDSQPDNGYAIDQRARAGRVHSRRIAARHGSRSRIYRYIGSGHKSTAYRGRSNSSSILLIPRESGLVTLVWTSTAMAQAKGLFPTAKRLQRLQVQVHDKCTTTDSVRGSMIRVSKRTTSSTQLFCVHAVEGLEALSHSRHTGRIRRPARCGCSACRVDTRW